MLKTVLHRAMFFLLIFAMFFAVAPPARAQFETGSLTGTIRDVSGAVIPNATVKVTNIATGVELIRQTDETGNYNFPSLRSGTYRVTVMREGFSSGVTDNVVLSVGTTRRIDMGLNAGGSDQTVEVRANELQLQTDTSQHAHGRRVQ